MLLQNMPDHEKIFFTGIVDDDKKVKDIIRILRKHKAKIHLTSSSSKKSLIVRQSIENISL